MLSMETAASQASSFPSIYLTWKARNSMLMFIPSQVPAQVHLKLRSPSSN